MSRHGNTDGFAISLYICLNDMAVSFLHTFLLIFLCCGLSEQKMDPVLSPQNCTLDCILKGRPECEFCFITSKDIETTLGIGTQSLFGSCVPRPCFSLLGSDSPACHHFVKAPESVQLVFLNTSNLDKDSVVVTWKPNEYGIEFLRGFQVSLQKLGGMLVDCQLLLFNANLSLGATDAQRVYRSDPFPSLELDSQYVVKVMPLPVPEVWESLHHSHQFSTRSCLEKMGLQKCRSDWQPNPKTVKVQQIGTDVSVTFELAPTSLNIHDYFTFCEGRGLKNITKIRVNDKENVTHHSFILSNLKPGVNYSCEISADITDPLKTHIRFQVGKVNAEPQSSNPILLAVLLALALLVLTVTAVLLLLPRAFRRTRKRRQYQFRDVQSEGDLKEGLFQVSGLSSPVSPPRVFVCYSSADGPAHVAVVMRFAAFLQQHASTRQIVLVSCLCTKHFSSDNQSPLQRSLVSCDITETTPPPPSSIAKWMNDLNILLNT
ncbi:interleukin-17 receptor D isoform X2 [Polyodon spathula]|uniref:interleukin-17 receptor D isoform X2 n=1 Tax=Polyodon spathula TaxID=7913 RepID=UPI001B7E840F|nr:interleukin-17 receptor D isoform X2 [Polyodon spathula]